MLVRELLLLLRRMGLGQRHGGRGRLKFRLALTWFAKHELAELLALYLTINLVSQLADVLGEHRILGQLLAIVLFDVSQLFSIWHLRVVYDWLHIILQLLHDVLVLQLLNIVVFPLHVCVEKAASLRK